MQYRMYWLYRMYIMYSEVGGGCPAYVPRAYKVCHTRLGGAPMDPASPLLMAIRAVPPLLPSTRLTCLCRGVSGVVTPLN